MRLRAPRSFAACPSRSDPSCLSAALLGLQDVGTLDSGLNSMVLASNNEMVLMPINEPTFGTKRKSQIQTYLEQNEVRSAPGRSRTDGSAPCVCTPSSPPRQTATPSGPRCTPRGLGCESDSRTPIRSRTCLLQGPGLQHLALKTDDIFHTLREMRSRSELGGFEFMPRASDAYYK